LDYKFELLRTIHTDIVAVAEWYNFRIPTHVGCGGATGRAHCGTGSIGSPRHRSQNCARGRSWPCLRPRRRSRERPRQGRRGPQSTRRALTHGSTWGWWRVAARIGCGQCLSRCRGTSSLTRPERQRSGQRVRRDAHTTRSLADRPAHPVVLAGIRWRPDPVWIRSDRHHQRWAACFD